MVLGAKTTLNPKEEPPRATHRLLFHAHAATFRIVTLSPAQQFGILTASYQGLPLSIYSIGPTRRCVVPRHVTHRDQW